MLKNKIYIDSIGVTIDLICRDYDYALLDLSTATSLEMCVQRPDGDSVTWTAAYAGTTHEILRYVTQEYDLDVPGRYQIQGKVTIGAWTGYSETLEFEVYRQFE